MAKIEQTNEDPLRVHFAGGDNVGLTSFSFSPPGGLIQGWTLPNAPVDALNRDLATLGDQVRDLKGDVAGKKDLAAMNERLEKMAASIERATERSQELKANIVLPPSEYLSVQLVPSHSLDRLEEYRADEKKAYALFGVFLGGALGIFSNWATQDAFALSKATGVLVLFFLILTIGTGIWTWQIDKRVQKVRKTMFPSVLQNRADASSQTTDDVAAISGGQDRQAEHERIHAQPASGEG
jgi:preprotein translocase subunit SecG